MIASFVGSYFPTASKMMGKKMITMRIKSGPLDFFFGLAPVVIKPPALLKRELIH
jgi:hypothetical protein